MCVVLVPNIGISTSISNTTQIRIQHLINFMYFHWECAWCQCQILVLAPAYPTLHKYAHRTSETSCVSTGNVRGASAKYWYQHQHIKHYTNAPTAVKKLHVCPLGMCVVLVPNIGISTSISNTTQMRPQQLRNFMCVHWECALCQCQILVLAPAYPTLHKYAHRSSETSCVSTGNVRGASAKYWYQHQHIQHYTNAPTAVKKLHVCPLGMCVVLVPNIGNSTSICKHYTNAPTAVKKLHVCPLGMCVVLVPNIGISTSISKHYTNTPTALQKLHVCPLGLCVVLVPNIGISTSISNTTQIRTQHFRKVMCVHWEFAWCQCQILVLAPAYPTLHKYAHSTSETSCVSTGNVRGASAKYWYWNQHIQHYTNTPTAHQKLHVCHWECGCCQCQILVLAPAYPTLHKYAHSTSERSCVSTGNLRGASAKYWYQHQHIQHYTNTPTALQKLHVCPLGMCVVLVPNIGIGTSISNTTQIRPQHIRNFMCVTGNVCVASAKYWYQHQHIQHYTNTPTALQKGHVCPLGICVVLVQNIGISTSISNTTQIRPQHFRNFMCVHWECAWCQCQILVLEPAYPTLHKYAHSTSETSCVSLGMCVLLVPNIGISTSISNVTQIRPQHFRKVMCVHWEFVWCQCQIMVLAPAYPTLHKYAHRTLARLCVSTGNVRGASAKYWYQHQHIQHYTNTPTVVKRLHVCPLGMCVVLVPNIGISTSISNTTQIRTQHLINFMYFHWECAWCQCQILVLAPAYPTLYKYAHSTSETSCVSTGNVRGASAKYWYQHQHIQHYTNTPTALQQGYVCPLGMCVVLVPNIGISTSISNITQIRPQQLRDFMCVHWECAWCQCQILVLAPAYPTLHKYAHSTS